jgi:hypothetical protein
MSQHIVLAATSLTAIAIVALAMLKGWQGWLALKEHELEHSPPRHSDPARDPDTGSAIGAARIELTDLKERIRKLEAIASGVDL